MMKDSVTKKLDQLWPGRKQIDKNGRRWVYHFLNHSLETVTVWILSLTVRKQKIVCQIPNFVVKNFFTFIFIIRYVVRLLESG